MKEVDIDGLTRSKAIPFVLDSPEAKLRTAQSIDFTEADLI